MNDDETMNSYLQQVLAKLDRTAAAVSERGYDEQKEECDDYSLLLQTYEFRNLVVFQLYEAYFPPKRHEYELELLTQLVEAVASSQTVSFLMAATVGGVVGNAAYDIAKASLRLLIDRFKGNKRTQTAFQEVADNLEKVQTYMKSHKDVRISQIASDLDIETYKIEPLLKLLKCHSRYQKKHKVWSKPD